MQLLSVVSLALADSFSPLPQQVSLSEIVQMMERWGVILVTWAENIVIFSLTYQVNANNCSNHQYKIGKNYYCFSD